MDATKRLRVVVVDKDRDATDSLVWRVQMAGHEAVGCYAGEDAIDKACANGADVMLVDLAMAEVEGHQEARRVRQHDQSQQTLLVAISEFADDAHRQQGMKAGFDHYLVKPIEFPALFGLLESQMNKGAR